MNQQSPLKLYHGISQLIYNKDGTTNGKTVEGTLACKFSATDSQSKYMPTEFQKQYKFFAVQLKANIIIFAHDVSAQWYEFDFITSSDIIQNPLETVLKLSLVPH